MTEMFEYLVKTLSRTRRKDYENYVVNRIWSLLNDTEIKPATQQYCRRRDSRYALLDMYFPQLGVAVECDEPPHDSSEASTRDNQRSLEIRAVSEENRIGAVLEHGIDIKRVSISEGIDQVNAQIDDIVAQLRDRKQELLRQGTFMPWDPTISDVQRALETGKIQADDNYFFPLNADVAKACAATIGPRRSTAWLKNADGSRWAFLWCAPLAVLEDGEFSGGRIDTGWTNFLSEDRAVLYESNKKWTVPEGAGNEWSWDKDNAGPTFDASPRVVFGKSRNALGLHGNRFLGVFQDSGQRMNRDGKVFKVYRRVGTTLHLPVHGKPYGYE